jgi:uncharacterized membrane protein YhfC
MNIHPFTVPFTWFSILLSFLLPVGLIIYFYKKEKVGIKTVVFGALTWIIFAQVFEQIVHYVVFTKTPLIQWPWLFAIYGAMMAGIFEEVGRFVVFKKFLKDKQAWKDGMAFGLGHGGVESILLGTIGSIQILTTIQMVSNGTFNQATLGVGPEEFIQIKNLLFGPPWIFLMIGVERALTLIVHIAFTLIVLYGVRKNNIQYLFLAIFLHAFLDFFAALFQIKALPIVAVEGVLILSFILSLTFIYKAKHLFK